MRGTILMYKPTPQFNKFTVVKIQVDEVVYYVHAQCTGLVQNSLIKQTEYILLSRKMAILIS